MNILNRFFPRRVEVCVAEAPHAPLTGLLAETAGETKQAPDVPDYERQILRSAIEDLKSKSSELHRRILAGPGREDRQLGLLADLLEDDLCRLGSQLERGAAPRPNHGRRVDDLDWKELDRRER